MRGGQRPGHDPADESLGVAPTTVAGLQGLIVVALAGAVDVPYTPVQNLPGWLTVLNRLDPLTYAVDPMRRLVFNHLDISDQARQALAPGVTWFGWRLPRRWRWRSWRSSGWSCWASRCGSSPPPSDVDPRGAGPPQRAGGHALQFYTRVTSIVVGR